MQRCRLSRLTRRSAELCVCRYGNVCEAVLHVCEFGVVVVALRFALSVCVLRLWF